MTDLFKRNQFLPHAAAIGCWLLLAIGCQKPAGESSKSASVAPAKTTHPVSESGLNTIELTEDAVRRLGLETQPVALRAMARMRSYGADLSLPTGASIIVSAPLAGTIKFRPDIRFQGSGNA